jgi:stress response protein YsnF
VPVLEEVLVVEKRLVVREELRITRRRTEERKPHRVKLLSEEVSVERAGSGAARGDADETDGGGVRSHAAPRS